MARGDKDYDKKVRKVNKGDAAKKKIDAVHKMVESLITGDSEAAAEHLHEYLQEKTRDLILGEKKEEKPDFADIDDDGDEKESAKKAAKDKKDDDDDDEEKEEVKESTAPKANLTKSRGPEFQANADKGKISGNSLRDKPKKSNDTKSRGPEFAKENAKKGEIKGNSLKKKPHKSNDTKATKQKFSDDSGKGSVAHYDDGCDYDMGTGNV